MCNGRGVTKLQHVLWKRGYKVYYTAYARNESPNYIAMHGRHGHFHRAIATCRATNTGHMTLEQAKTVLLTRILMQATKVRLRYKRIDFLATANRGFRKTFTSYTHVPFCCRYLAYHKPYLRVRAVLLHSSDTYLTRLCRLSTKVATTRVRQPCRSLRHHDLWH